MASGWSHQNTQHLSIKFIISYGHGSWHPKTMAKSHQGSLITDHHNGYSHAAKVWNIQRITKMWHREVKWANAVGKMVPVDLLHARLPQTISFKEKPQYLWSTAKQSTITPGMPVIRLAIKLSFPTQSSLVTIIAKKRKTKNCFKKKKKKS